MKTIFHLYFSPFEHESRVMRAARAALEAGLCDQVVCVGYRQQRLPARENPEPGIQIIRLQAPALLWLPRVLSRSLRWLIWSLRASRLARKSEASLIQCHSLAALPSGAWARARSGIPVIYDAHELETERAGWPFAQKVVARWIERTLLGRIDEIVVVGSAISQWYAAHYEIAPPHVVRNIPDIRSAQASGINIRERLGVPAEAILFIYLGAIGFGRGIEMLITAFATQGAGKHLLFLGYGESTHLAVEAAARFDNIHYLPPVAPDAVIAVAQEAEVGVAIIEDVSLSYRYCLPNKLFECRHAGLPIMVSNLPEMAAFIDAYGGGWKVNADAISIAEQVSQIDRASIKTLLAAAALPPSWRDEQSRYTGIVERLLRPSSAARDQGPLTLGPQVDSPPA